MARVLQLNTRLLLGRIFSLRLTRTTLATTRRNTNTMLSTNRNKGTRQIVSNLRSLNLNRFLATTSRLTMVKILHSRLYLLFQHTPNGLSSTLIIQIGI